MASFVVVAVVAAIAGLVLGAYLVLCFAISREDRRKGSLRSAASSPSARSARSLVGISGTRQDR
jgi:hypothetical protein